MSKQSNNRQTIRDQMDPARAKALYAVLGLGERADSERALPPFFHQIYFWDIAGPDNLGRDGHQKLGGLIPDLGLPRRMWAGGQLEFHAPLRTGLVAVKTSFVDKVVQKTGRTGPLAFVTLRHEIHQEGARVMTEMQDLVYRQDPSSQTPVPAPKMAPEDPQNTEAVTFSSTLLFRYSALTMNSHRIHHDAAYAREVENYPGLVVHGPLLAQLLMLKATREMGPLAKFSFRATAPLLHWEQAALCREAGRLWVRGPDGRLCMKAKAELGFS